MITAIVQTKKNIRPKNSKCNDLDYVNCFKKGSKEGEENRSVSWLLKHFKWNCVCVSVCIYSLWLPVFLFFIWVFLCLCFCTLWNFPNYFFPVMKGKSLRFVKVNVYNRIIVDDKSEVLVFLTFCSNLSWEENNTFFLLLVYLLLFSKWILWHLRIARNSYGKN